MEKCSFNPCCLGLAVLAHSILPSDASILSFNPCCLGLAVLAKADHAALPEYRRFQSLLSWISRFGYPRGKEASPAILVSILFVLD